MSDWEWLEKIAEREKGATPGPWRLSGDWIIQTNHITRDIWNIAHTLKFAEVNRGFIAHSRSDVPKLLTAILEMKEALEFYRDEVVWTEISKHHEELIKPATETLARLAREDFNE